MTKCNNCGIEITMDIHCTGYGTDGPEPPFYCSGKCWQKGSRYE